MSEWWTYSVASFLLFSPRAYARLFELYNIAIWPIQIVLVALGAALLPPLLVRANHSLQGRAIASVLAVCWSWIAFAFHWQWYATINWAASYFAAAFALEALLLLVFGVVGKGLRVVARDPVARHLGLALYLFALVGHPLVGIMAGRNGSQSELFGAAPDPTAIGTIGIVVVAGGASPTLLAIPLAWCAVSAALLAAMGSPQAWTVGGAGLLGLFLAGRNWRRTSRLRALGA